MSIFLIAVYLSQRNFMRIAINGFGRIGRNFLREFVRRSNELGQFQVVAINDLADTKTLAHLLKYDSVHGGFNGEISYSGNEISVNGNAVQTFAESDPSKLPWASLNIDIVIESTGFFRTRKLASKHLEAGAKKVILSAPSSDKDIKTVVLGVNNDVLSKDDVIVSNASCTTNNAAPLIQIIDELCEIETAYITTVHSYTSDQKLHDAPHKDLRRARSAPNSIVPTTTGAAKAITRIFPHLEGKIGGCGIRVPVPNGSMTDITCVVKNSQSVELINEKFKAASKTYLKGILDYTEDPIVSVDIMGNPHSCLFDAELTSVIGNMVKVVGWYDNEIGYSNRLLDLLEKI